MFNTAKTFKFTSQSDPDVPASSWRASVALLTLTLFPAHLNSAFTTEPRFDWSVELQVIPSCTLVAAPLPCPCLVLASKGPCSKLYPPAVVCQSCLLSCLAVFAIFKLFSWGVNDEDIIPCSSVCGSDELFDKIWFIASASPPSVWKGGSFVCGSEAVKMIFWAIAAWRRMLPWAIVVASVE